MINWIRVEDELPFDEYPVLVVLVRTERGRKPRRTVEIGQYNGTWTYLCSENFYKVGGDTRVTHWAELPDLPAEEETERKGA